MGRSGHRGGGDYLGDSGDSGGLYRRADRGGSVRRVRHTGEKRSGTASQPSRSIPLITVLCLLFGVPMPDALIPMDIEAVRKLPFAIGFAKQNYFGPRIINRNLLR